MNDAAAGSPESADTTDTLLQKIAELESNGADRFDPVRFCYIRSMTHRSAEKSGSAAAAIYQKASAALAGYQKDYESARKQAEEAVSALCEKFPETAKTMRHLFENNEFAGIRQLGEKLRRRHRRPDLSELKNHVGRLSAIHTENRNPFSVDDLLLQQEQDVIASLGAAADPEKGIRPVKKTEITSLKRFRKTMAKMQSDRLVTRAINNSPEQAGPHNSQMLAINTLSALREISTGYLERGISHVNTLIWLQQAAENAVKDKAKTKKKPGPK